MTTDAHPAPSPSAPRRELDVRPLLADGREPFSVIMEEVASLDAAEVLALRSPFEPEPLHSVLGKRGYRHLATELAPGDWETLYWRADADAPPAPATTDEHAGAPAGAEEGGPDDPRVLDVRGLTPPEPMERTLAVLADLPDGERLVQINDRVPVFLLPLLDERGYRYGIDEDERGTLVTIWREEATA